MIALKTFYGDYFDRPKFTEQKTHLSIQFFPPLMWVGTKIFYKVHSSLLVFNLLLFGSFKNDLLIPVWCSFFRFFDYVNSTAATKELSWCNLNHRSPIHRNYFFCWRDFSFNFVVHFGSKLKLNRYIFVCMLDIRYFWVPSYLSMVRKNDRQCFTENTEDSPSTPNFLRNNGGAITYKLSRITWEIVKSIMGKWFIFNWSIVYFANNKMCFQFFQNMADIQAWLIFWYRSYYVDYCVQ